MAIPSSSSEKREWVVVTMAIYPLPLVWERRCVVVVTGIRESEGNMTIPIHLLSSSSETGVWVVVAMVIYPLPLVLGKGDGWWWS